MKSGTHIHHTLQVVDIDITHHVGFADAEVRRGEYPHVEEVVINRDSNGISTLLMSSEAMDPP